LSSYNGHSGAKREQVQAWLNKQWNAGALPRPSCCAACGQVEGIIDAHLENYDEPTSYVEACVTCHLVLHCRFRYVTAFAAYVDRVGSGWQAPPLHTRRNALGVLAQGILRCVYPDGVQRAEAPGRTFLDDLLPTTPLW
jgi:hypothetical protein